MNWQAQSRPPDKKHCLSPRLFWFTDLSQKMALLSQECSDAPSLPCLFHTVVQRFLTGFHHFNCFRAHFFAKDPIMRSYFWDWEIIGNELTGLSLFFPLPLILHFCSFLSLFSKHWQAIFTNKERQKTIFCKYGKLNYLWESLLVLGWYIVTIT